MIQDKVSHNTFLHQHLEKEVGELKKHNKRLKEKVEKLKQEIGKQNNGLEHVRQNILKLNNVAQEFFENAQTRKSRHSTIRIV